MVIGLWVLNAPLGLQDADGRREERLKMAEALARAGDVAGAARWITAALDIYPYPEAAHLRMATAFVDGGRNGEAADHLRQLGARPAGNETAEFWLRAGRLAARIRSLDAAVTLFGHAVRNAPSDVGARDQLAIALMLTGNLDAARTEFEWVTSRDGNNADALAHLGYIAAQQNRLADAKHLAERALRIQPGHPLATQILRAVGGGDAIGELVI